MTLPLSRAPNRRRLIWTLISLTLWTYGPVALAADAQRPRVRSVAMPRVIKEAPAPAPSAPVAPIAQADEDLPLDRDALFGTGGGDLFDVGTGDDPDAVAPADGRRSWWTVLPLRGFVDFAPAYAYESPGHWARGVVRTQVEAKGTV